MLRASPAPLDAVSFSVVVREGALVPNGMPRFEEFDEAMLAALRQYPGRERPLACAQMMDGDGGVLARGPQWRWAGVAKERRAADYASDMLSRPRASRAAANHGRIRSMASATRSDETAKLMRM